MLCQLLFSCDKPTTPPTERTLAAQPVSKADTTAIPQSSITDENHEGDAEKQYVYLTKIFQKNGTWWAEADNIQFLTGKKALEEAKKRNLAESEVNEKGEKEFFLANDYIIINDHVRLRAIEIEPAAAIFTYNFKDGSEITLQAPKTDITALQQTLEQDYPYTVDIKNGKITEIRQVFIP